MNLRTMMLVLMVALLMGSFGYAATDYTPLERIQGEDGLNTYKNNFLGMQITTPSSITTKIPVSSFERAPGDRMFFNSAGDIRVINVMFHYEKFNKDTYIHESTWICGGGTPCSKRSYEQIKNSFNISNLIKKIIVNSAYASVLDRATLKVDIEKRRIGENEFFFYAIVDKNSGKKEYYFIYPSGEDYIEFAFFDQPENLIASIMKSVQFFKGEHENPNYPYWTN